MEQYKIEAIAKLFEEAVAEGKLPGAVMLVGNGGKTQFHEAWGYAQLVPEKEPMTKDTVFDIASLSKLVGTWSGIILLLQEGRIQLTDTLPELLHHQKMRVY